MNLASTGVEFEKTFRSARGTTKETIIIQFYNTLCVDEISTEDRELLEFLSNLFSYLLFIHGPVLLGCKAEKLSEESVTIAVGANENRASNYQCFDHILVPACTLGTIFATHNVD